MSLQLGDMTQILNIYSQMSWDALSLSLSLFLSLSGDMEIIFLGTLNLAHAAELPSEGGILYRT